MGLLDDAIREHLELKRRRGADPGEVAREQREALDPVPRDELAADDDVSTMADGLMADDDTAPPPAERAGIEDVEAVVNDPPADREPVSEPSAEETAELDMQSVLGGQDDDPDKLLADDDSLEWEVPADAPNRPSAQGSADDAMADEHLEDQDLSEDVLGETPDFLRETPEQERLWFEQRPPRDFDFDK